MTSLILVNDFSITTGRHNDKVFHLLDLEVIDRTHHPLGHSSIKNLSAGMNVRIAKEILARNIIADFLLRCNEERKEREGKARKVIADSVWRAIASRRRQKLRDSAIIVQKVHRGHLARNTHFEAVQQRLEDFRRFNSTWKETISQVPETEQTLSGWSLVREQIDLKKVEELDDEGNFAETDEKLNQAMAGALQESCDSDDLDSSEEEEEEEEVDSKQSNDATTENGDISSIDWSKFQVSVHVIKFIKNGDHMYRDIFVKRMKQLAKGERSHKLQKPLKGCESIIYESYMDVSTACFLFALMNVISLTPHSLCVVYTSTELEGWIPSVVDSGRGYHCGVVHCQA